MRKVPILLLMMAAFAFSLNITTSTNGSEIAFAVDGPHYAKTNLTMFLFKDDVQIGAYNKTEVVLPYIQYVPYNETAKYELRLLGANGEYAVSTIGVEGAINNSMSYTPEEEQGGQTLALIVMVIGAAVIVVITAGFLKRRSYSK